MNKCIYPKFDNTSLWTRFRLLFIKPKISCDISKNGDYSCYVTYKEINDNLYIIDIQHGKM